LYLRDPDGNGVELYWDRPREQWPVTPDGKLGMYTRALDLHGLLAAAKADEPVDPVGEGPKDLA
jgi:catechol 2,3-dioxygenase